MLNSESWMGQSADPSPERESHFQISFRKYTLSSLCNTSVWESPVIDNSEQIQ
jgi:hypothetical protein